MNVSRLAVSVVAAALVLGGASCSKIINAPQFQTGTITHVVVCTLKDKGNYAAARQQIFNACRDLRGIAGVYDIEVGPALPSSAPGGPGPAPADFDLAV